MSVALLVGAHVGLHGTLGLSELSIAVVLILFLLTFTTVLDRRRRSDRQEEDPS